MNTTRTFSLLPGGGEDEAHVVTVCVESWSEAKLRQGYNVLLFCSLYCFPVLFNLVICFLTGRKLWGTDDKQLSESSRFGIAQVVSRVRIRKRIAIMVLALVVLFTLSWLPLYAVDIGIDFNMSDSLDTEAEDEADSGHARYEWLLHGRPFAQWLGLTNSALNPLCYCFVGNLCRSAKRFRKSYREKMSSVFSLSRSSSVTTTSVRKTKKASRRAQSEKEREDIDDTSTSNVYANVGSRLTKSKSLSAVTVCETVFD